LILLAIPRNPSADPPQLIVALARPGDRFAGAGQVLELPSLNRLSDHPIDLGLYVVAAERRVSASWTRGGCGAHPQVAVTEIATLPSRALETGQLALAFSAIAPNCSAVIPSTTPATVNSMVVIPVPGTKVAVAS